MSDSKTISAQDRERIFSIIDWLQQSAEGQDIKDRYPEIAQLPKDKDYLACLKLLSTIVHDLESTLTQQLSNWCRRERFFKKSKPAENFFIEIQKNEDLQKAACALKEIYAQFPDEQHVLFQAKDKLNPLLEKVSPPTTENKMLKP